MERKEAIHLDLIQTETYDTDANVTRHGLDLIQTHLSQSIQDASRQAG
jgi:hypothetical protein